MNFFYYILSSYLVINGFYYFFKNFKSKNQMISYIFRKALFYLEYNVEDINLEELPSKIIVIGSHTSIYDFILGTFFYYGYLYEKYDSHVLMKKEFEIFCKPILQFFDKKFKLISIDSSKKNIGVTEQICNNLISKDNYILYIAPEGTRKCTDKIKSGYWYISKKLDIDILYIGLDFSTKIIMLEKCRKSMPTWEEEQEEFIKACKKYIPLYPERCYWTRNFYTN